MKHEQVKMEKAAETIDAGWLCTCSLCITCTRTTFSIHFAAIDRSNTSKSSLSGDDDKMDKEDRERAKTEEIPQRQ